jgi:hypothetical protein
MSKKVEKIIEIWDSGMGVVSLHCFQSVIPVEAYTREACMIDAIGNILYALLHECFTFRDMYHIYYKCNVLNALKLEFIRRGHIPVT